MRIALRATAVSAVLIVLTAAPVAYATGSSDTSGENQYGYVFPSSGGPKQLGNKPSHTSPGASSNSPTGSPGSSDVGGGNAARGGGGASSSTGGFAGELGSVLGRLPGKPGSSVLQNGNGGRLGRGQPSPFAGTSGTGEGQSGTSFAPARSFLSAVGDAAKTTGTAGLLIILLLISLATVLVTTVAIRSRRVSRRRI